MKPDYLTPSEALPLLTPTIRRLFSAIMMRRADRTALVRPPNNERLAALMVFGVGDRAMGDLLPTLVEASDALQQIPRREPLELSLDEDLDAVFTWMETTGLSWFKLSLEPEGMRSFVYAFSGNEVCKQLAPKLTTLGVPVIFREWTGGAN